MPYCLTSPADRLKAGWRRVVCVGVVLLALLPANLRSQPAAPDIQYSVKAVCLLNFAQFVKWPAQSFASNATPITIGVLGTDPFGKILDDAVRGEKVGERKLAVKRVSSIAEARTCQMLFVSRSEQERMDSWLAGLKGAPVLTVSETDSFCQRGGMINFVLRENRVKFEANPEVAEAAGLTISSKLLNLAKIVKTEQEKAGR